MGQYSQGSVAVTNGSAVVTGTGTSWLTNTIVGALFTVSGDSVSYEVASVDGDSQVTLSAPYAGTTASGLSYSLTNDFTDKLSLPYFGANAMNTPLINKRQMLIVDMHLSRSLMGSVGVSTISDLASLPKSILTNGDPIQVMSYSTAGDGGQGMVQWDSTSIADEALGMVVASVDGDPGRHFRRFAGSLMTSWAGAADGGSDVSVVQAQVDYATYQNNTDYVALGPDICLNFSSYSFNNTLHLGYGTTLTSVHVRGYGLKYRGDSKFSGTTIVSSVTDRPAISISGNWESEVRDLHIEGPAKDAIKNLDRNDVSILSESTWDSALASVGVTAGRRYAPHVAIAIDPYGGTQPGTHYPDVSFPSWLTPTPSQYGKAQSSGIKFRRVHIEGFEVGVAVQPSDFDANGDFTDPKGLFVERCKYAISVGNTQSRSVNLDYMNVLNVWTLVTTTKHGKQNGKIGAIAHNVHVAGFLGQIFEIGAVRVVGPFGFDGFYGEAMYRLGTANNVSTNVGVVPLTNGVYDLQYIATVAPYKAAVGALISGVSDDFFDCYGSDFYTQKVAHLGNVRGSMEMAFNQPAETIGKAYEALGMNLLSGGLIPGRIQEPRPFKARMWVQDSASPGTVVTEAVTGKDFLYTGRDYCIPWACCSGQDPNGSNTSSAGFWNNKPMRRGTWNTASWTGVSVSGRTITATLPTAATATADAPYRYGILPGCAMIDPTSGTVMFIRSFDTSTREIIMELQNNYYYDVGGSSYQILDTSFSPGTGVYYSIVGLTYCPTFMLWGDITAGSAVITNVVDSLGAAVATDFGLTVGDRFAAPLYKDKWFNEGSWAIASGGLDTTARTITLSGNANYTGRIPLPWWFRQPPANATSR